MESTFTPLHFLLNRKKDFKYISAEPTWISSDAEVKKESLGSQQNIRHTQADQACAHLPAEAKYFIGELCIHGNLQQDMQIDEHVIPAIRSKDNV